jgi:hypothetical protein
MYLFCQGNGLRKCRFNRDGLKGKYNGKLSRLLSRYQMRNEFPLISSYSRALL